MVEEGLVVTILSMAGGAFAFFVSTYFVVQQLRWARQEAARTHAWNRRKASEELLIGLITGEFPALMDRLVVEFGWNVLYHEPYEAAVRRIRPEQVPELDATLRNALRYMEVVCINIKHDIIDEDICYDYLRSILTTVIANCEAFIEKEREGRRERRVFVNSQFYSRRWIERIEAERPGGVA